MKKIRFKKNKTKKTKKTKQKKQNKKNKTKKTKQKKQNKKNKKKQPIFVFNDMPVYKLILFLYYILNLYSNQRNI
jgi:quinol-cytochrome oxidoreductase complex cytochrome b subunit